MSLYKKVLKIRNEKELCKQTIITQNNFHNSMHKDTGSVLEGGYQDEVLNSDYLNNSVHSVVEILYRNSNFHENSENTHDQYDDHFFFSAIKNNDRESLMSWRIANPYKNYIINEFNEGPVTYAVKHSNDPETLKFLLVIQS